MNKVLPKRRVALTVDVEAHPIRALNDHVNRLIWGRQNGREAGIQTMMDIADRHGVPMTFFLDYPEVELYGEELLDVGREIHRRGHDLQPHCHTEYLMKRMFDLDDEMAVRLSDATPDQCRAIVDELVTRHIEITSRSPLAYRSGAYLIGSNYLDALKAAGIIIDASYYYLHCSAAPKLLGLYGAFRWANGLRELPIPLVPHFRSRPRLLPWNFNAAPFCSGNLNADIQAHRDYLRSWFKRCGDAAVATLVLHSWSFWKMDAEGHFTLPADEMLELFDALLLMLKDEFEIISVGALAEEEKARPAALELVEPALRVPVCPICHEPASHFEDFNGIRRRCPFCGSVERHRTLVDLLYAGAFGQGVFHQRDILHIAPGRPEKLLLRRMYQPRITTLNIQPGCDLQADIQNMPELADNSFDVVLASGVFRHVRDLNKALAEIARVLRPGGLLLCSDCLDNADYGREITDIDEQTAWYGREKRELYGIGDFRRFGRKDWEAAFAPYFLTRIFKADDTATGSPAWWMACTPRPESTRSRYNQIETPSVDASILRSNAGRIFFDAAQDSITHFLPDFDNWQDYRRKSSSYNLASLKENIFTLCFRQYQVLPSARSSAAFPSRIPEDIHPYKEQCLRYLLPELSQDDEAGDNPCLQHIVAETERWIDTYGFFSQSSRMDKHTRRMVWNDASAAIRLNVMAYIFLRILPLPDYPAVLIEKIFRSMQDHFSLLCTDHFFTARHNHGWLQMFGLLSFCRAMPQVHGASIAVSIATERILMLCEKLLTRDGMLREHSPAYQAFVITLLANIRNMLAEYDGAMSSAMTTLDGLLENMRTCLDCLITPDGRLVTLGDSSARPYDFIEKEVRSAVLRMKADGLRLLPHSGYAMLRLPSFEQADNLSFLAVSGAFHSYTHKHCDDLSFVWSEGCQNILIDSGQQISDKNLLRSGSLWEKGFFYSSPNCVYAASAHAHNIVEINGETWSRRIAAYGILPLRGQRLSEKHWLLEGEWQRPEGFRQQRRLILSPGRWLLVLDTLTPLPDTPQKTTRFSQWFHLAPTVELEERQELAAVFRLSDDRRLHCRSLLSEASLTCHKGECFPRLQGWVADTDTTLIPAWTLGWHSTSMTASFCTIFSLIGPCLKGAVTENSCAVFFTHGPSEEISWKNTANTQNI